MRNRTCEYCNRYACHGECENYILDMVEREADGDAFSRLFKEIPKFNYVLEEKINAIFGTDLEVASESAISEQQTKKFEKFIYGINANGNTNFYEIKKAIKEKEIFGEGYLFFDSQSVYAISRFDLTGYQPIEQDPVIDNILYYTVGAVDIPEELIFPPEGFIKQEAGYIISPDNIIKFKSDSYALNSDLKQLQILLEINRKLYESTTKRDYGDIFLFTSANKGGLVSSVANATTRIKETVNKAVKKMRDQLAKVLKQNKVDDSNVVILDEVYKDVKQITPITKVTDYKFIWEKKDEIITSVFNFPMILAGLGDGAGNVSKKALIEEARANTLTPIKSDTANSLTKIAKKICGEEYYLRFKDYEPLTPDSENLQSTKSQ